MKTAILIVSFGSSNKQAVESTIIKLKEEIKSIFPSYCVKDVFASKIIVKLCKEKYNTIIQNPKEALKELSENGYEEVIILPFYMTESESIKELSEDKINSELEKKFKRIIMCEPLIRYDRKTNKFIGEDFIEVLTDMSLGKEEIIYMAHGSKNGDNLVYEAVQSRLLKQNMKNVNICLLEGRPTIEELIPRLIKKQIKRIELCPMMLMGGKHVNVDLISDNKHSWKYILEKMNIEVSTSNKGLAENKSIRKLFIKRLIEAIEKVD